MDIAGLCNRKPVVAYGDTPLADAARLMRDRHVGSLIIVVERLGERFPVGILTDRDIVMATIAKELDPRGLTAGEVMSRELFTLPDSAAISDALALMRERGIRRLPVLTSRGSLAGIITLDDLLAFVVSGELSEFVRIIDWQRVREACLRG